MISLSIGTMIAAAAVSYAVFLVWQNREFVKKLFLCDCRYCSAPGPDCSSITEDRAKTEPDPKTDPAESMTYGDSRYPDVGDFWETTSGGVNAVQTSRRIVEINAIGPKTITINGPSRSKQNPIQWTHAEWQEYVKSHKCKLIGSQGKGTPDYDRQRLVERYGLSEGDEMELYSPTKIGELELWRVTSADDHMYTMTPIYPKEPWRAKTVTRSSFQEFFHCYLHRVVSTSTQRPER